MTKGHFSRIARVTGLILVLASGLAKAADTPDAWVTMKTKVSLMTTEGVDTHDLNVDTVKGVVTLHGKVATEAEKLKAEKVARGIEGTRDVKNLLQVVPSVQRATVERSDDEIKKGVEAAFKANKRVEDSGIKVSSVNKGVVLLSGKTKSMAAHRGVRRSRQRRSRRAARVDGSRGRARFLRHLEARHNGARHLETNPVHVLRAFLRVLRTATLHGGAVRPVTFPLHGGVKLNGASWARRRNRDGATPAFRATAAPAGTVSPDTRHSRQRVPRCGDEGTADRMRIGMPFVTGDCFSSAAAAQPLSRGIARSMTIRSGFLRLAI